jgi:hypothetical protein
MTGDGACPACGRRQATGIIVTDEFLAALRADVREEERARYHELEVALRRVVRSAEFDRDGLPWPGTLDRLRAALAALEGTEPAASPVPTRRSPNGGVPEPPGIETPG